MASTIFITSFSDYIAVRFRCQSKYTAAYNVKEIKGGGIGNDVKSVFWYNDPIYRHSAGSRLCAVYEKTVIGQNAKDTIGFCCRSNGGGIGLESAFAVY